MDEIHDAWFFIGVFVFIFLIWIAVGGPLHPISFTGPVLSQPSPLGGGTYLQLPRAAFSIGDTNVSLPGSSSGNGSYSYRESGEPTASFLSGTVFGTPSPYRDIVSMNHYVSNASSSNPSNEYIEISIPQNADMQVNLSGWKFVSEATGIAAAIPKGAEVPTSGIVNSMQNIMLSPGERAIIISGMSPIGTSFRENKCIGYFSTFQQFSPYLPQNCPTPSGELLSFYGDYYIRDPECLNYVNNLSRCQAVLYSPDTLSNACKKFAVQYLNYNGCVIAHNNDADFEGNTWRIYLNRTTSMWRTKYEVVKLLDINNKTVDAFSY